MVSKTGNTDLHVIKCQSFPSQFIVIYILSGAPEFTTYIRRGSCCLLCPITRLHNFFENNFSAFENISVHITTKIVSSNPAHGTVYSMQHYVIKFVTDLEQVDSFLRVHLFPPQIKVTAMIKLKHC